MKKLFISQPMRGKTDEEILKEREKAIEKAKSMLADDVEVIDSFFTDDYVSKNRPLYYLGKSLTLLAEADVAYFVKGWEYARGCKIEHTCAIEYGVECIEEEAYHCIDDGLTFGEAIQLMKKGAKIARKGWNGKGMFVVYQKGYPDGIPCNKQTAEAFGYKEGELFKCRPYMQMRCADGTHQMWVASQSDILTEDWYVVE